MADSYSGITMDVKDIRTIEKVFADMDLGLKLSIDIKEITDSLRKFNFIDDCMLIHLEKIYITYNGSDSKKLLQFNRFLWEIVSLISFEQLLTVLSDSGNQTASTSLALGRKRSNLEILLNSDERRRLGDDIRHSEVVLYNPSTNHLHESLEDSEDISNRGEIPRPVSKFRLPHADHLSKFYIELKIQVDNNALKYGVHNGSRDSLELMISKIDMKISSCDSSRRKQLLIDKRVLLYFLLAQLCADFSERINILKRLHDSMPYGVDRTMFKAIYHSNMAVSWALKGNDVTALEHVSIAQENCSVCSPCLPVYVSLMGAHITHSEVYLCHGSVNFLQRALNDFENVSQLVQETTEDEQTVWKSGTLLIMASALLGIKFFSKVCDNFLCPDIESVKKARQILAAVRQLKSLPKHRELMLYLCMGKLHEVDGNRNDAIKYIRKAQTLADSCSTNIIEKSNISAYLERLQN